MARVNICKICKEPIWNHICINCLADHVQKCIPSSFSEKFSAFHRKFISYFSSVFDAQEKCLRCKNPEAAPVCMHCYITEVFVWMRDENPELVSNLQPLFNYDFDKHEEFIGGIKAEPVTESENMQIADSGICDECGEYSEELTLVNGEWVCKECIHGIDIED